MFLCRLVYIELKFSFLEIQHHSQCDYDSVAIIDGLDFDYWVRGSGACLLGLSIVATFYIYSSFEIISREANLCEESSICSFGCVFESCARITVFYRSLCSTQWRI